MLQFTSFFIKFKPHLLVKIVFSLLHAAVAMAILHLIPRVHLVIIRHQATQVDEIRYAGNTHLRIIENMFQDVLQLIIPTNSI